MVKGYIIFSENIGNYTVNEGKQDDFHQYHVQKSWRHFMKHGFSICRTINHWCCFLNNPMEPGFWFPQVFHYQLFSERCKVFQIKMQDDLGKMGELLASAREHALEGDYYSAQAEYEEYKSQIEKRGVQRRTPSIKRVARTVNVCYCRLTILLFKNWKK